MIYISRRLVAKLSPRRFSSWTTGVILRTKPGIAIGKGSTFYGRPIVRLAVGSTATFGDNLVLVSSSKRTALGVNHPVVVRTLLPTSRIYVGHDVGMSGGTICCAASIRIGDRVLIGANVTIVDTDFHSVSSRGRRYSGTPLPDASDAVTIGDDVFLGEGCVILKGATIGNNAVVGARAVVTGVIPSGATVVGAHARILKS